MIVLLLSILGAFLLGSVPIYIALAFSTIIIMVFGTDIPAFVMVQRFIGGIDKFALMSMPFFIFAANIMKDGGLSTRILNWSQAIVGRFRGGLALTTQVACMFFGALSGSSPATVAAMGKLMYPELLKQNYNKDFSAGLITSAGSVAILIPPSVTLIVYGSTTGASVGSLFVAGIGAGILYGIAALVYIYFYARKYDLPKGEQISIRAFTRLTKESSWALGVPVIILGGIYLGIFTPTEAAAISAVYAIFVGMFVYKELTLKDLFKTCINSAVTTAQVFILMSAAQAFGWLLTIQRVPQILANGMLGITSSPYIFLFIVNIILLITGMFMAGASAIIILAPLIYPIAIKLGIDPVHLGIIMTANLAIGMFTPPFGLNLFISSGITGLSVNRQIPGLMAFIVVSIFALLLLTYIPEVSLWLPGIVYGH